MRISIRHHHIALFALRVALGLLFGYFGTQAVMDPASQLGWLADWVLAIPFLGTEGFIRFFGVLEMVVAAMLIVGIYVRVAAFAAAGMLLLITVNLGFSELAMRDFVLFIAALVVATVSEYKWELRRKAVI